MTNTPSNKRPAVSRAAAPSPSPRMAKKQRTKELEPESVESTAVAMSAEEMELYDRQIRLWGLEAQTKMRTSRILVAGICGLSNEICKNIVLAGIGRVTLLDSHIVVERDLGAQFFLTVEDIGKNIADAVAPRIRNLNPRVNLEVMHENVESVSDSFFADFDLVLVAGKVHFDSLVRINNVCRNQGIRFISAAVFGTHGYMFADLLNYEYVEERSTTSDGVTTVKRTKKTESYVSLETACTTKFDTMKARVLKRVSPVYFGLQLLWEYEREHKRLPNPDSANDAEDLLKLRQNYIAATGGDATILKTLLTEDIIRNLAQQAQLELSPVCAIVGGIVSQDVLNIVSGKEVDVCNFFCFGDTVGGVVRALGNAAAAV